jgi:2-keto-3-deoxy-L-fuconate dehydrogenase
MRAGEFTGLRVLVTGGGSGIGAAIAARLVKSGARVAVLDLAIDAVPHDVVVAVLADVSDDVSVGAAVVAAAEALGGIDIVVNNAAIGAQGTIEDNDDAEWHRVWDINVVGLVRVSRAALPFLRRSAAPAIVNLASVVAEVGLVRRALYGATKGAVAALTRAMAADYLAEGIRVNAVSPGTADTPWVARLLDSAADPAAARAALVARQPHGRLVTADEVAGAVAYLASPLSGSTNGVVLEVDGGMGRVMVAP